MPRRLYIVSVYRPDLLDEVIRAIGVARDTEIFIDRRVGERREPVRAASEATRRADRRHLDIASTLRTDGFAVVELE
jgi:hypothetical protein